MALSKNTQRIKRHKRLRRKVVGSTQRPRLQIHRTLHHIYAAVIDDSRGHTLVTASTRQKDVAEGLGSLNGGEAAKKVGEIVGRRGRNGAGKSTTVDCVVGLRAPSQGRIRVAGLDPRRDRGELRQLLTEDLGESIPAILPGETGGDEERHNLHPRLIQSPGT